MVLLIGTTRRIWADATLGRRPPHQPRPLDVLLDEIARRGTNERVVLAPRLT